VILGDAAHAMVPFYGQGMNAGLEDVRILFSILDKHAQMAEDNDPTGETDFALTTTHHRSVALEEYSATRVPDAHAINDLALQNYVEMRASVLSPRYRLRKFLEEKMSVYLPGLGWQTKYSRISFGNERYSEVVARSDYQGKILVRWLAVLVSSPAVAAALVLYLNRRKIYSNVSLGVRGFWQWMSGLIGR
jgi:kynurenine 3-monooxygenase